MSNQSDALARARTNIEQMLKDTKGGTADKPRRVKLIDLAIEHAESWAELNSPDTGERGGTSTSEGVEELQERDRIARMASAAAVRLPEITKQVDELAKRLPEIAKQIDDLVYEAYSLVQRLTAVVHPEKYPTTRIPGCSSCARKERKGTATIGGHFAPVYDKSKASGLCRWCWDHQQATGTLPDVQACEMYHAQGPRAAGLWLAKQQRRAS